MFVALPLGLLMLCTCSFAPMHFSKLNNAGLNLLLYYTYARICWGQVKRKSSNERSNDHPCYNHPCYDQGACALNQIILLVVPNL